MNGTMELQRTAGDEREMEQYFTFFLKDALYGIEIGMVREIIEYERICQVPCVPGFIAGIINVRGEIIPIIDLSKRLFSRETETNRYTAIAIVEVPDNSEKVHAGIMVDRVNRVRDIPRGEITTPEAGYKIRADFMKGIASDGEDFIMLLNMDRVLNVDELSEPAMGRQRTAAQGFAGHA